MLGSFVQLGKIFTGGKPFSALFKELMENVRQILGAEGGSLYLYDKSSQTLKIVVLTKRHPKIRKSGETFDPLRANGFIQIETRNDKGEVDLKICPLLFSPPTKDFGAGFGQLQRRAGLF